MKKLKLFIAIISLLLISCNSPKITIKATSLINNPKYKQTTLIYKIKKPKSKYVKIKTIIIDSNNKTIIDSINNQEINNILNTLKYNEINIIYNEIYY